MNYKNDDIIENSDSGYNMNLDRIIQEQISTKDVAQEEEIKRREELAKMAINILKNSLSKIK